MFERHKSLKACKEANVGAVAFHKVTGGYMVFYDANNYRVWLNQK